MKIVLTLALSFALSGCGYSFFAAKTRALYVTPDGVRVEYESDKEQQNLHFEKKADGSIKVSVDKAGAQEQAIAAMMQSYASMMQMLQQLMAKLPGGVIP